MGKADKELQSILGKMEFYGKMYQIMLIMDPIKEKLYLYHDKKLNESDINCYEMWNKRHSCENCTAKRALQENDVFVKVEYIQDDMYMIIAVPVIINNKRLVVELLNNISGRLAINEEKQDEVANFNAMTGERLCYSALAGDAAAKWHLKQADTKFDPKIVDIFINQVLGKEDLLQ